MSPRRYCGLLILAVRSPRGSGGRRHTPARDPSSPSDREPHGRASETVGALPDQAVTDTGTIPTPTPPVTPTEYGEQDATGPTGAPAPSGSLHPASPTPTVPTSIPSTGVGTARLTQAPTLALSDATPRATDRTAKFVLPVSIAVHLSAQGGVCSPLLITVPAGAEVTIIFENLDENAPHNVVVYGDNAPPIFVGTVIRGPARTTDTFTAPSTPGKYVWGAAFRHRTGKGPSSSSEPDTPVPVFWRARKRYTDPRPLWGLMATRGIIAGTVVVALLFTLTAGVTLWTGPSGPPATGTPPAATPASTGAGGAEETPSPLATTAPTTPTPTATAASDEMVATVATTPRARPDRHRHHRRGSRPPTPSLALRRRPPAGRGLRDAQRHGHLPLRAEQRGLRRGPAGHGRPPPLRPRGPRHRRELPRDLRPLALRRPRARDLGRDPAGRAASVTVLADGGAASRRCSRDPVRHRRDERRAPRGRRRDDPAGDVLTTESDAEAPVLGLAEQIDRASHQRARSYHNGLIDRAGKGITNTDTSKSVIPARSCPSTRPPLDHHARQGEMAPLATARRHSFLEIPWHEKRWHSYHAQRDSSNERGADAAHDDAALLLAVLLAALMVAGPAAAADEIRQSDWDSGVLARGLAPTVANAARIDRITHDANGGSIEFTERIRGDWGLQGRGPALQVQLEVQQGREHALRQGGRQPGRHEHPVGGRRRHQVPGREPVRLDPERREWGTNPGEGVVDYTYRLDFVNPGGENRVYTMGPGPATRPSS